MGGTAGMGTGLARPPVREDRRGPVGFAGSPSEGSRAAAVRPPAMSGSSRSVGCVGMSRLRADTELPVSLRGAGLNAAGVDIPRRVRVRQRGDASCRLEVELRDADRF